MDAQKVQLGNAETKKKDTLRDPLKNNDKEPLVSEEIKELSHCSIEESVEVIRKAYFSGSKLGNQYYKEEYAKWAHMLEHKLNLCFYGMGCKTLVIDDFVEVHCKDMIQVKIKGSSPGVKTDSIFMKLIQVLEVFADPKDVKPKISRLHNTKQPKNKDMVEILKQLITSMKSFGHKLLIVFHDMDGRNFREEESHKNISELVKSAEDTRNVFFIGSFTNYNFPILWSKSVILNYTLAFIALHTHTPDAAHLASDEVSFFNKRETKGSEAIKVVYDALTEGQKEILRLLAQRIANEPTGQV